MESPGWQVWGAKPKHNIPFPAEAPPALQGPVGCEEHEHLGTPEQLLLCTPLPAEAKPSHPLRRKSSKPFKAEPKASSAKAPAHVSAAVQCPRSFSRLVLTAGSEELGESPVLLPLLQGMPHVPPCPQPHPRRTGMQGELPSPPLVRPSISGSL